MAIGDYTKTTYVNGSAPALNATNLNNAENQIKEITDAAVSGGANPTKIWTSSNDGNGGQPPSPKETTGDTPGKFVHIDSLAGNAFAMPAGGTWAYAYISYDVTTGSYYSYGAGIAAGGTRIGSAITNIRWFTTYCKRIA